MYGPARLATNHTRRAQRRRARLANPARRVGGVAVQGSAATAPAWTPPAGLPGAGLVADLVDGPNPARGET